MEKSPTFSRSVAEGRGLRIISLLGCLLALALLTAAPLAAQNSMCQGQKPATEGDLAKALSIMHDIMDLGPGLRPEDEETIIRGQGLTSDRMNCLLGKFMAGNDIFGWGTPAAYGVDLSREELNAVRKFKNETQALRRYLEEVLNIKAEQG